MSSLAAARADNFYFPPDWRPEYGGISKFQGSKGANQYQQHGIIRFELPFDGWCKGCKRHVGKGTRFNAKKDEAGKYFTTKIWAFTMKCASCDQKFVIKTDPENRSYDFAEGIQKMEQDFTPDFNDSIIVATTDEERLQLASNPIYKLQHVTEDKKRALSLNERLVSLEELQRDNSLEDYARNSSLRSVNRKRRRQDKAQLLAGRRYGLNLHLLDSTAEEVAEAKSAIRKVQNSGALDSETVSKIARNSFRKNEQLKIMEIQSSNIFSKKSDGHSPSTKISKSIDKKTGQSSSANKLSKLRSALTKKIELNINPADFLLQDVKDSSGVDLEPSETMVKLSQSSSGNNKEILACSTTEIVEDQIKKDGVGLKFCIGALLEGYVSDSN